MDTQLEVLVELEDMAQLEQASDPLVLGLGVLELVDMDLEVREPVAMDQEELELVVLAQEEGLELALVVLVVMVQKDKHLETESLTNQAMALCWEEPAIDKVKFFTDTYESKKFLTLAFKT